MSDLRRLLDAVLANPDDRATRRVAGDELQRSGDPRGELIAVQCALEELAADDPRRRELERSEVALLRSLLPAWRRALRLREAEILGFHGGLLDHLRIETSRFLKLAPSVTAEIPLARLDLLGATRAWVEELARMPAPPTLRELEISETGQSDCDAEAARALADSPWLARLRRLQLHRLPIGHDGVAALVASPRLAQLEDLELRHLELTSNGLAAALAKPGFARLRAFTLLDVRLGETAAREIAGSSGVRTLRRLELKSCALTANGMQHILRSAALTSLEQLSLCDNQDRRGEPVFVGPELAATLRRLDLARNGLDDDWAGAFAAARPLALTHLDLRNNLVSAAGVRMLIDSPKLAALTSLSLAGPDRRVGEIWGADLARLVALPGFARLRAFNADNSGVTTAGVAALAASPHARELRNLRLNFNALGPDGACALAASPHLRELEVLDLGYTQLGDDGVAALCAGAFPRLRHLGIQGNRIGERGFAALLATSAFPALRTIYLTEVADEARRRALEAHLGAIVDLGDYPQSLGLRPVDEWWTP